MAKAVVKRQRVQLPTNLRFEIVDGKEFIEVREAARLANIHPTALEMGQRLLSTIGNGAASFSLSDGNMQQGDEIAKAFKGQLRRVAKVFAPDKKLRVKAVVQGNRLSFWFHA